MKYFFLWFLLVFFQSYSQIDSDGDGLVDLLDNCPNTVNGPANQGLTVAGGNGQGLALNQLSRPRGIAVHNNNIYIADRYNHRIVKWIPGAKQGEIVAGGNGNGLDANQLDHPTAIILDESGNMYIVDEKNHRIQKWEPESSEGTTVAGGNVPGSNNNQLNRPKGLVLDSSGNLYVLDRFNHRIQKWKPESSEGTTVAGGNGQGSNANQLDEPNSIVLDDFGNFFITDGNNHRIQKWEIGSNKGTTVAGGNGNGSASNQLNKPRGALIDNFGNLYIADRFNHRIQFWKKGLNQGVTIAGGNGEGSNLNQLKYPNDIFLDSYGFLFIVVGLDQKVQKWEVGQADLDGDGIGDVCDECPDTPSGNTVNFKGCPIFFLPNNNNKVEVTSASCIGTSDGSIGLSVEDNSFDYSITVTGKDDPIAITGENKTAFVTGLAKGTYSVCFKVTGQSEYEQCFEVVIVEPKALGAFIDVDNDKRTTSIQLSGSNSYNIDVNGKQHQVIDDNFTTSLRTGLSIVKISTDLDCQGVIEREVFISEDIFYYPNPTNGEVDVFVNGEDRGMKMRVFTNKGDLVFTRDQEILDTRKTELDLTGVPAGTYLVTLEGPTVRKTFKIVKR